MCGGIVFAVINYGQYVNFTVTVANSQYVVMGEPIPLMVGQREFKSPCF